MAEGAMVSRNMKDMTYDNEDASSQFGQEDYIQHEPGYTEERFRVDRRKLEQMLQVCNGETEVAESFFQKIMEQTNTTITWPSKLKIGAKSKKDPHIKVAGKIEDVARAKDKVMIVLDTKSNRVTLKMDVSHTEHSHVIGKGGNNIKKVMQDTGCHIHFPDSNRGNQLDKSNQVSIAGQPMGVEQARQKIRDLLPLVFMFELPATGVLQPLPDASTPRVQQIQQSYGVSISFKQRARMYSTTVIVRGSVNNAKAVKEATNVLIEHLTGSIASAVAVTMQLEIAPQHHLFMMGRAGANVKQIMHSTGASIHFPDPSTVTPPRKGTVYITGAIESVYQARAHVIGCLPLVLMFDMKEDSDIEQVGVSQLMEQLDVFISVKPKPKQPSKSVIVKSIERNAANMYEARQRLLGLSTNEVSTVMSSNREITSSNNTSNSLGLAGLGLLSHNLLNINTNPLMVVNGFKAPMSPHSPVSPACTHSHPTSILSTPPGLVTPMVVMAPHPAGYQLQSAYNLATLQNGLAKDMNQNTALLSRQLNQSEQAPSQDNLSGSGGSPAGSPPSCPSPHDLISPKHNTSTVTTDSVLNLSRSSASQVLMDMLSKKPSPCSSTSDLLGMVTMNPSNRVGPKTSPSGIGSPPGFNGTPLGAPSSPLLNQKQLLEEHVRNMQLINDQRSSESGCDSDGSDNRAPGSNRPIPGPSSLFPGTGSSLFSFDYEQKKILANKAMQKQPVGSSSRTPTDYWSGLGFSKSMPDSAIREKIQQKKLQYNGPSMTTMHETQNDDIDRDPWKDSPASSNHSSPSNSGNPPNLHGAPGERKKLGDYTRCLGSTSHHHGSSTNYLPKTDMSELFDKLGLGKYSELFQQQEIDMSTFLTLSDQDLKELGISTFGARRKMLLAITDLKEKQKTNEPVPPPTKPMSPAPGANNPFRDVNASALIMSRRHDLNGIASQSGRW